MTTTGSRGGVQRPPMSPEASPCIYQSHPAIRLSLPGGDTAVVAVQGAQLLSWTTADGTEHLYLSPRAAADGYTPIRGGVPVCFPQFNQRVLDGHELPKHGLARSRAWAFAGAQAEGNDRVAEFRLTDSDSTRALWPVGFEARLAVRLGPGRIAVGLRLRNTGDQPWPFAAALHTYLRVDDVAATTLHGLDGAAYWDGVADLARPDARRTQTGPLVFGVETDRVYDARTPEGPSRTLTLQRARHTLTLKQSASMTETVVWNPGPALGATLGDMPPAGWRDMLCVEAACIDRPVRLAPGASWQGWQALHVAAAG